MRLIKATIEQFVERIKKKNLRIVLFGAGAMGKVLLPYISNKYELDERMLGCMDNNVTKQKSLLELSSRKIPIYAPSYIEEIACDNFVVLITNGDFYSVIKQLEQIERLKDIECYLLPVMQLMEAGASGNQGIVRMSSEPLIPKTIHYCWFSGSKIPEALERCIGTWKEMCPDYEIVRWDESNYDVKRWAYTSQAYEAGKWGFIPDVARLEILYSYGGFYLDTDVRLLRNLDALRYQPAFCGREEWGHVNFGGGSGCKKHCGIIKEILDFRKNVEFTVPGGYNTEASAYFETTPLTERGLSIVNETEIVDELTVYGSEYFHPYNYISGTERITENTISIHYFNGGWLGEQGKKYREETREKYDTVIKSMLPVENN